MSSPIAGSSTSIVPIEAAQRPSPAPRSPTSLKGKERELESADDDVKLEQPGEIRRSRCRACRQRFANANLLHNHLKTSSACNIGSGAASGSSKSNGMPHKDRDANPTADDLLAQILTSAGDRDNLANGHSHTSETYGGLAVHGGEGVAMQKTASSGGSASDSILVSKAETPTKISKAKKRKLKRQASRLALGDVQAGASEATIEIQHLEVPAYNVSSTNGPPSPSDSTASSTDETPYLPRASASVTSPPKIASQAPADPVQDTPRQTPFLQPVTAFDFLPTKFNFTFQSPTSSPTRPQAPAEAPLASELPKPSFPSHSRMASEASSALTAQPEGRPKKRIPASPMTWGNAASGSVKDPPTLGSGSGTPMTAEESRSELARTAYKASHGVARDTIVQELAKRMQEGLARAASPAGDRIFDNDEKEVVGMQAGIKRLRLFEEQDGSMENSGRRENPPDGVLRLDMQYQGNDSAEKGAPLSTSSNSASSAFSPPHVANPFLSPGAGKQNKTALSFGKSDGNLGKASGSGQDYARTYATQATDSKLPNGAVLAHKFGANSIEDTSTIQAKLPSADVMAKPLEQIVPTSTTDGEEDDGAVSDASGTSVLIKEVVRDTDERGWGDNIEEEDIRDAKIRFGKVAMRIEQRFRPSIATINQRRLMIDAIRRKLNGRFMKDYRPDFNYTLMPFGSTAYGLDTDTSDLDLCIVDPRRPDGFRNALDLYDPTEAPLNAMANSTDEEGTGRSSPSHNQRQRWQLQQQPAPEKAPLDPVYSVFKLATMLRTMGMKEIVPIPTAGVPIVKFVDHTGLKADMNTNEQLGVRNSALLAAYINMSPIIRPFLSFLKIWSKQRGLNDPSGQKGAMSLSSYSTILLAIGYLQHINLVPNLQDLELIKTTDTRREAFWSKIPNKEALKARGFRNVGKFSGDYKALPVETTFVRRVPAASWEPTWPSADYHRQSGHGAGSSPGKGSIQDQKRSRKDTGWESDSNSTLRGRHASPDGEERALLLADLIEGFFRYYSSFPVESKAVSVWRGQPLARRKAFKEASGNESSTSGSTLSRRRMEIEEEEEAYEEAIREQEEELDRQLAHGGQLGQGEAAPLNDTSQEAALDTDEEERREQAETNSSLNKIEQLLKEHGRPLLGPRFDQALRSRLPAKENGRTGTDSAWETIEEGGNLSGSDTDTDEAGLQRDQALTPTPGRSRVRSRSPPASPQAGLSMKDADPHTHLFPFPEQEDPETFASPSLWAEHKLVVQDPFIHSRNTCTNIQPRMVDRILGEFRRAHEMLQSGASLEEICLNIKKDDSEYGSSGVVNGGERGWSERRKERREATRAQRREEAHARRQGMQMERGRGELEVKRHSEREERRKLKKQEKKEKRRGAAGDVKPGQQ